MGSRASALVLLLLFVFPLCWAQSTYYVTPTPETPCPGEPCRTLSEYVAQMGQYFTSNTTFMFLSGNHTLEKSVLIEEQTNLSLIGESSSPAQVTSRIVCSQPASVSFCNVSKLLIDSLAFISCGKTNIGPAVILNFAPNAILTNCLFQNNTNVNDFGRVGGALAVIDSNPVEISESTFIGNTIKFYSGGGIFLLYSKAVLTGNTYINNDCSGWGGGVYSQTSIVNITDSTFMHNTASYGGAIEAYNNSSVSVTLSTVMNNTAGKLGGGVDLFRSEALYSNNTFMYNFAESGGAFSVTGRRAKLLVVENVFSGNHANDSGGGGFISSGSVTLEKNCFMNNCAVYNGGGLFVNQDDLVFVTLTKNSFVTNRGSGWVVFLNTTDAATFTDNVFVNNTGNVLYGSPIRNDSMYYVTPTHDTPCLEEPCLTLTEYVQQVDQYFTSNTTLVFLPGNHTLENGLLIANISSLTLLGSSQSASNIICARPASFLFQEISEVYIGSLAFISCGDGSNAAMNLYSIYFVEIFDCVFWNNTNTYRYGGYGGALYVFDSNLTLSCSKFMDNRATSGGGINILESVVTFVNSSFTNNIANHAGGGVDVCKSSIFCQNTVLDNNTAKYGGAMRTQQTPVTSAGVLQIVNNTAIYGAGVYIRSSDAIVSFNGNTSFYSNAASYGGAIYSEDSLLYFNETAVFVNNSALNGGGMLLSSNSKCYFQPETNVYFKQNSAEETGGAIDVQDSNPLVYCPDSAVSTDCFFQIMADDFLYSRSQVLGLSISILFENNSASKGGDDVYSGAIDTCDLENIYSICQGICDIESSGDIFDTLTGNHSDVASDPIRICLCNSDNNTCKDGQTSLSVAMYPGTTLHVPVLTLGQRDGPVPAAIQSDFTQRKVRFYDTERIQDTNGKCTDLHYTVLSASAQIQENITLYAQGPCPRESRSLPISIEVLQCPHGFQLGEEACVCDQRLESYTDTCDINRKAVFRPRGAVFWIGYNYENATQGLILHPHCPFDYCTQNETFIVVDNASEQCSYGRTGKLCGECMTDLSLVLGSSRCLQCSNTHLAMLVAFAFAGVVLVLFLFALKLTVAVGTINGLIFYANVVQVNAATFLPPGGGNILTVFIAWLNLDLGIETCFYNGMDTYAKTWLQFVFPLYVWILVGIIIIVSHYSQRIANLLGNNPIAVLATLFLLSYAKILRTTATALAITYLEYPDGERAVWSYDGSLSYFNSRHGPLFLVALLFLLLLFFPYTLLLFLGQWIQAKSDWKFLSWINKPSIKIFLDAHYAPYADKHRYWTGLILLIRFILFLIFILNALGEASVNLLYISTAAIGIIAIGFLSKKIYKKWYLNALEVSFTINLGILASATYHVRITEGNQAAVAYTSIGIAFSTFVGIVLYHIFLQLQDTKIWKMVPTIMPETVNMSKRKKPYETLENSTKPSVAATTSSVELREPLLESTFK